jgi:hypothetical protein
MTQHGSGFEFRPHAYPAMLRIEESGSDILVTFPRDIPLPLRGAALLSATARPPARADDPRTLETFRAFGRLTAEAVVGWRPALARTSLRWPADALMMPLERARRIEKTYSRKLEERMGASAAFAPFLLSALASFLGEELRSGAPPTVDRCVGQAIEAELQRIEVFEALGSTMRPHFTCSPENFEQRVLRESLPVIHLCVAVATATTRSFEMLAEWPRSRTRGLPHGVDMRTGKPRAYFGWNEFLFHKESQDFILECAEVLEPVVADARLKSRRGLVRVRCV